jgi:hypothetical protein
MLCFVKPQPQTVSRRHDGQDHPQWSETNAEVREVWKPSVVGIPDIQKEREHGPRNATVEAKDRHNERSSELFRLFSRLSERPYFGRRGSVI